MYIGRVPASSPIWDAVRDTAGQVLLWEGELFPAFYHSASGGYTEDPRTVFAARNMPALTAIRDEFSTASPHFYWSLDLRLADLSEILRRNGFDVGGVTAIDVHERTASLRVSILTVHGTRGSARLRGNDFRRMIGYETIKSTLFAVALDGAVPTSPAAGTAMALACPSGAPRGWPARGPWPKSSSVTTTRGRSSARWARADGAEPVHARPGPSSARAGLMEPDPMAGLREGGHARRRRYRRPRVSRGPAPGVPALDRFRPARHQALERPDRGVLSSGGPDRAPGGRGRQLSAEADRSVHVRGLGARRLRRRRGSHPAPPRQARRAGLEDRLSSRRASPSRGGAHLATGGRPGDESRYLADEQSHRERSPRRRALDDRACRGRAAIGPRLPLRRRPSRDAGALLSERSHPRPVAGRLRRRAGGLPVSPPALESGARGGARPAAAAGPPAPSPRPVRSRPRRSAVCGDGDAPSVSTLGLRGIAVHRPAPAAGRDRQLVGPLRLPGRPSGAAAGRERRVLGGRQRSSGDRSLGSARGGLARLRRADARGGGGPGCVVSGAR